MDHPIIPLGFRDLLVQPTHALNGWPARNDPFPTVGATPFDEREVKSAQRTSGYATHRKTHRPIQISGWQGTRLRDQLTLDGLHVARFYLRDGTLTTTAPDGQTPIHSRVRAFIHILEDKNQEGLTMLATTIPTGAILYHAIDGNPLGTEEDEEDQLEDEGEPEAPEVVAEERPCKRSREMRDEEDRRSNSADEEEVPLRLQRESLTREAEQDRERAVSVVDEVLMRDEVGVAPSATWAHDDYRDLLDYRTGRPPRDPDLADDTERPQSRVQTEPVRSSIDEDHRRYAPYLISSEDKENVDPTTLITASRSDHGSPRSPLSPLPANRPSHQDGEDAFQRTLADTLTRLGTILNRDDAPTLDDLRGSSTAATPGTGNSTPAVVAYSATTRDDADHEERPSALTRFSNGINRLVDAAAYLQYLDFASKGKYTTIPQYADDDHDQPMDGSTRQTETSDYPCDQFSDAIEDINEAGESNLAPHTATRLQSPDIEEDDTPAHAGYPVAVVWNEAATKIIHDFEGTEEDDQGRPARIAVVEDRARMSMADKGTEARTVRLPDLQYPVKDTVVDDDVQPPAYSPLPHEDDPFNGFQYPMPFHLPDHTYHSIYTPAQAQPPVDQHRQMRDVFALAWRHIYLQARVLDLDKWCVDTHARTHVSCDPCDKIYHNKIFLLNSEWVGNPFLWAYEESTLQQCREFLKHMGDTLSYDTRFHIRLISQILAFRMDGPDGAIVVQQRLSGLYGMIGELAPKPPRPC